MGEESHRMSPWPLTYGGCNFESLPCLHFPNRDSSIDLIESLGVTCDGGLIGGGGGGERSTLIAPNTDVFPVSSLFWYSNYWKPYLGSGSVCDVMYFLKVSHWSSSWSCCCWPLLPSLMHLWLFILVFSIYCHFYAKIMFSDLHFCGDVWKFLLSSQCTWFVLNFIIGLAHAQVLFWPIWGVNRSYWTITLPNRVYLMRNTFFFSSLVFINVMFVHFWWYAWELVFAKKSHYLKKSILSMVKGFNSYFKRCKTIFHWLGRIISS
jgi:hypothetical protein